MHVRTFWFCCLRVIPPHFDLFTIPKNICIPVVIYIAYALRRGLRPPGDVVSLSSTLCHHLVSMPTTMISEAYKSAMHGLRTFTERQSAVYRPSTPQSALLVGRLPIEILQSVFEFFVANGGQLEVLFLVSNRWRDAAVGYSKLRSYINISGDAWDRRSPEDSLAMRVRRAVIESEGSTLHVTIDGRSWGFLPERPFNLALEECAGEEGAEMWRWETLKLDLGQRVPRKYLRNFMPQLRELTYRTTDPHDFSDCFRYTGALRTLRLDGDFSTIWPASVRNSVQHLHIESNEGGAVWRILQQFTSISSLFLTEMADLKRVSNNEVICLSKLRELRVAFPEYEFPSFHASLRLPSLTDLTLYTAKRMHALRDNAKEVSVSFAAILPQLEKLTIVHMGCSSAEVLRETLHFAVHLEILDLNGCGRWKCQDAGGGAIPSYPQLSETFYHVLEDPLLCPRLTHCVIDGVERPNLVSLRERP